MNSKLLSRVIPCLALALWPNLQAEEKASSVMTALSATTIAGSVDTSAQWGAGPLVPAPYRQTACALVGVIASAPVAREGVAGSAATFVIYRRGSTNQPLTIPYVLSGSATPGVDYARPAPPKSQLLATILAGAHSTRVVIRPIDDQRLERRETVVLSLARPLTLPVFPPVPLAYQFGFPGFPGQATAYIVENNRRFGLGH